MLMDTNASARWQGQMIGRYRLLELRGSGHVGEVWQAEDTALQRRVAIKLLPPVLREETDYLRAFAENARAAASLEHPHILPVHDFGEFAQDDEIITYLVMPWIASGSLRDLLLRQEQEQEPLPPEISFQYLRQAAEAIDFAHQRGILHRNVTPGNMLIQERDLYLSDFSLARLLGGKSYRSHNTINASSPEYMAPELAEGRASAASDRYSLAVVAYELFTGHLPFQDDDPIALLLKQLNEQPPAPRSLNPHIPAAVERTLLRGLAKSALERHPTCHDFVDELTRNWRQQTANAGDPEATALAPWSKYALTGLETRRSQPLSEQNGAANLQHTPSRPVHTTDPIAQAETVLLPNIERARRLPTISRRALLVAGAGAVLLAGGGLALASALSRAARRGGPQTLIAGQPLLKLTGHQRGGPFNNVWNARWHPAGNYLASLDEDGRVMLWDIASLLARPSAKQPRVVSEPAATWTVGSREKQNTLSWSPDGETLALLSAAYTDPTDGGVYEHAIACIDVFSSNAQLSLTIDQNIETASTGYDTVSWSPTGDTLATATYYSDGTISLWALKSGKVQSVGKFFRSAQPDPSTSSSSSPTSAYPPLGQYRSIEICWSADGSQILQLDRAFNILAWDVQSGKRAQILALPRRSQARPDHPGKFGEVYYTAIQRSPTSTTQFVVNNVDVAVVFDIQQKKALHTLGTTDRAVYQTSYIWSWSSDPLCPQLGPLAWSPNGRYLAGCYLADERIFVWDLANPQPKLTKDGIQLPDLVFAGKNGHSDIILDLAWSPDGRYLASSSADVTIIIWKVDGTA